MNNFVFRNPTKLIFGKGTIARLADEIPAGCKLMVTFGGGSVKKNGVYEQVTAALKGRDYIEFWGIEPNPKIETLRKAVEQCRRWGVDFLLAVGGGSVLDGTKLIAAAVKYHGDAWDLVRNNALIGEILPFGDVMTLPATASEMNRNAVISSIETKEKFGMKVDYPRFSILDPQTTFSLPRYQRAAGMADTFIHVMEQYMTVTGESPLMDRWSEGILQTLVEIAPSVLEHADDYDGMANYMLCATMGLNGFIAMGVTEDWATHQIGHELTAINGLTHGHTLAIVFPGLLKVLRDQKMGKILQYGERVWGIHDGTPEERAARTIDATENFFRSLGLQTRLHEVGIGEDTILEIERRFNERGVAFGEGHNVNGTVARQILEAVK